MKKFNDMCSRISVTDRQAETDRSVTDRQIDRTALTKICSDM